MVAARRLLRLAAGSCALAAACDTLPAGAPSLQVAPDGGTFTFGTSTFSFTFDADTFALRNVTTCSADGKHSQGLLSDDTWGGVSGRAAAQSHGSLWQLNYTDCKSAMPLGVNLDALTSPATKRSHHVAATPAGGSGTVLTLRWLGVGAGPGLPSGLDVSVTVRMGVESSQAALGAWVDKRGQSDVCIQDLALPNLRLVLRDKSLDELFAPWFFGQAGSTAAELPGWEGGLDLWKQPVMGDELPLMPAGGTGAGTMQYMATYSSASGAPLGIYVGAHDPESRLMMLMMEASNFSTAVVSLLSFDPLPI